MLLSLMEDVVRNLDYGTVVNLQFSEFHVKVRISKLGATLIIYQNSVDIVEEHLSQT
jgi:hypothetical protein